jgi:organic radical activating enzyme
MQATTFTGDMYAVKEIFYTLQGKGANAGQPRCFVDFRAVRCLRMD